jgi:hypothetical protein
MNKKLLLLSTLLITAFSLQAQVTIYDTTHAATNGVKSHQLSMGLIQLSEMLFS